MEKKMNNKSVFKKASYDEIKQAAKSGKPVFIEVQLLKQWGFGEYLNEPDNGYTVKIGEREQDIIFEGAEVYQKIDGDVNG